MEKSTSMSQNVISEMDDDELGEGYNDTDMNINYVDYLAPPEEW